MQSFLLDGNRIAVLKGGGLEVKEIGTDLDWVRVAEGVSSYKLNGDRIGVIQNDVLNLKSGSLTAAWYREAAGITMFQLQGSRIVFLGPKGALLAKDGGLDDPWVTLAEGVQKFQVAVSTDGNGSQTGNGTTSGGWRSDSSRGEITRTIQLASPQGQTDSWSKDMEVLFPAGYTYCRHSLSANYRNGPGGVSIVTAEPERLVFGVWSERRTDKSDSGGVQVTATVTGINDAHQDDSACNALPQTGGGCGNLACPHYLDSAESDNGTCLATSCMSGRSGAEEQVCVYNLRADDQAQTRARVLACRNIMNILAPARSTTSH